MLIMPEMRYRFKMDWWHGDNDQVVFDYRRDPYLADTIGGPDEEKRDILISKHSDYVFECVPVDEVVFDNRDDALYYLYHYGCVIPGCAYSMSDSELEYDLHSTKVVKLSEDMDYFHLAGRLGMASVVLEKSPMYSVGTSER